MVFDDSNPHIRDARDGTTIKLDVNDDMYTMDKWVCFANKMSVSEDIMRHLCHRGACRLGDIIQEV